MALTLYVAGESVFHRLHPLTKLTVFVVLVVAAFVLDHPLALLPLAASVGGAVLAAGAGGNLRRLGVVFVMILVFTVVIWTFFYEQAFRASRPGFLYGLATGIRLDTFLAAGILFLSTTRVEEAAYALARLGLPYQVGFTVTLAFRLVPVFYEAALSVVQAQRCRGLDFRRGGLVGRLRRFVPVLVPVFIGALRRADRMAIALELRGFNSGRPRTSYPRPPLGTGDAVAIAGSLAVLTLYIALWAMGIGRLGAEAA